VVFLADALRHGVAVVQVLPAGKVLCHERVLRNELTGFYPIAGVRGRARQATVTVRLSAAAGMAAERATTGTATGAGPEVAHQSTGGRPVGEEKPTGATAGRCAVPLPAAIARIATRRITDPIMPIDFAAA
jgi:hypothetical protein